MRIKKLLLPIAVVCLWLCGLTASADVFLYELSFDQKIGTRTFGRLAGGEDGYGDLTNGDSPVQQVFLPDIITGYDRVSFQGSGVFEAGTDLLQLYQWLQLGRDVKNPDGAASTWVLVIDERFFTESALSQLSMTWKLVSGYSAPAGTLELVKPDGTVATNMKSGLGPVVFAKTPSGSQLGPGRYQIRYRKKITPVPSPAPATPEPIATEMPWAVNGQKNVVVCAIETGKSVQLIAGQVSTFKGGSAVSVATGSAEAVSSGGQWLITYTLPNQIDGFDQVVIGYRITTATGSADSFVTFFKSGIPQDFPYAPISQGWNLLAAPPLVLLPADPGFDALVALRPLIMNGSSRTYMVLRQSAQMTQCRAFWLFNASASSPQITLGGLNNGAVSPSLHSGWNFTGVADKTKSVADLNVISAWCWNGRYYVLLKQETILQPGVGYWLYRD